MSKILIAAALIGVLWSYLSDDGTGCPVAKDNFCTAGATTTCSCRVLCESDGKKWPARSDDRCYMEDAQP